MKFFTPKKFWIVVVGPHFSKVRCLHRVSTSAFGFRTTRGPALCWSTGAGRGEPNMATWWKRGWIHGGWKPKNRVFPLNHPLKHRLFRYFHHPFLGENPIFGNTQVVVSKIFVIFTPNLGKISNLTSYFFWMKAPRKSVIPKKVVWLWIFLLTWVKSMIFTYPQMVDNHGAQPASHTWPKCGSTIVFATHFFEYEYLQDSWY